MTSSCAADMEDFLCDPVSLMRLFESVGTELEKCSPPRHMRLAYWLFLSSNELKQEAQHSEALRPQTCNLWCFKRDLACMLQACKLIINYQIRNHECRARGPGNTSKITEQAPEPTSSSPLLPSLDRVPILSDPDRQGTISLSTTLSTFEYAIPLAFERPAKAFSACLYNDLVDLSCLDPWKYVWPPIYAVQ